MDPKELALKHFEKAILAGFAVWLVFSLISVAKPPAELAAKQKLDTQLGQIKDYMDTAMPPNEPPPTWVQDLTRLVDPKAVPQAENGAYPGWLAWRRPNMAFVVKTGPTRPPVVHATPREFKGAVARGKVELSWQIANDENALIMISKFEVQRREAGKNGEWAPIGELRRDEKEEAPPTALVDDKVAPRSKYEYRLIETAEIDKRSKEVENWKLTLPDLPNAPVTREITFTMDKETPRDVYIVPAPGSADIPTPAAQAAGAKPKVTLKVYKWNQASGGFSEKQLFQQPEGTKNVGGTGAELVEVTAEERKVNVGGNVITKTISIIKLKWPGVEEIETVDEVNLPAELKKPSSAPPPRAPKGGAPSGG